MPGTVFLAEVRLERVQYPNPPGTLVPSVKGTGGQGKPLSPKP